MLLPDFDTLHNIAPGKHLYQFYKNADDYLKVMLQFMKCGLKKGNACLWIVSEKIGVKAVMEVMELTVQSVSNLMATKQFAVVSAEDWYLTDGRFDAGKAIQRALDHYQFIRQLGFRCLRVTGDAAVIPAEYGKEFAEYEKKCDSLIRKNAIIAACAYPIFACSLENTRKVIHSHEDVMVGRL